MKWTSWKLPLWVALLALGCRTGFNLVAQEDTTETNQTPEIVLKSPPGGLSLDSPSLLPLIAEVTGVEVGDVAVEFLDGDSSLGWTDSPFAVLPGIEAGSMIGPSGIYSFEWRDIGPGTHEIAAILWLNGEEVDRTEISQIEVVSLIAQPEINLRVIEPIALEGGGTRDNTAVISVERSGPTDSALEVFVEWEGEAKPDEDFVVPGSSVVIAAGESSALIEVMALNDAIVEEDEKLRLRVLPPICIEVFPPAEDCYLVGRNNEAVVTIRDDDAEIENEAPLVVMLEPLSGQSFREGASVSLRAQAWDLDGQVKAIEFLEGDRVIGQVTFDEANSNEDETPNQVDPDIPLPPSPSEGSFLWENVPAGRFVLRARAMDEGGLQTDSTSVFISVANSTAPALVTIEAVDSEAQEGGAGSPGRPSGLNGGQFEVRRSGDVWQALVVGLAIEGSATNGRDYGRIREQITIPAGRRSASIQISPLDDREAEGTETVLVGLRASDCGDDLAKRNRCYAVGRASRAQITIEDDDRANRPTPPRIEIVRPRSGAEFKDSQKVMLFAAADDQDGRVVSVEFFANGESLGVVRAPGNGRSLSRFFRLDAGRLAPGRYEVGAVATDDDQNRTRSETVDISVGLDLVRPVISVQALDPVAAEVASREDLGRNPSAAAARALRNTASFLITRTGLQDVALTIPYRLSGSAENGVDYVALSGAVELAAGASRSQVLVVPIDDLLVEGREEVVLELLPIPCLAIFPPPRSCYTFGRTSSARVVINDNEVAENLRPELKIVSPEDGSEFDRPRQFEIQVAAMDPDGFVEEVTFHANDRLLGGVKAAENVGRGEPQRFVFNWVGPSPGKYSIEARGKDNQGQVNRSESVTISVVESLVSQTVVSVEAIDPIAAEVSEDMESDIGVFRFQRRGDLSVPVEVSYRIAGNAVNGSDFERVDRRFVFEAGEDAVDLIIQPLDDNRVEGTEYVEIALVKPVCIAIFPPPPACYSIGENGKAALRILDNDRSRNLLPKVAIVEPRTRSVFQQPAQINVRVDALDPDGWVGYIALFAGEAQVAEQTLTFIREPDPGQRQHFDLVWDDAPVGIHELTAVVMDDQGGRARSRPVVVSVRGQADVPVVTVFARDGFASEPNGNRPANKATFRIRRTGSTESELRVRYDVSGLAVNGEDYEELTGLVTIPAKKRWATLEVIPLADEEPERLESVLLSLVEVDSLAGSQRYSVGQPGRAGVVIGNRGQNNAGPRRLEDGSVHVCIPVPNGQSFRIESSTALGEWDVLGTNTATDDAIHIVDTESTGTEMRFYRLVPDVDEESNE